MTTFKPNNRGELSELLGKLIKKRGNGGDFNDIDTSLVTDMSCLFQMSDFNGDISSWDVSNVKNMVGMFNGATSFNQDLSSWDVSNVTDMDGMFRRDIRFNQDTSKWDVSNVTDMSRMFLDAKKFNQDLSKWDVSNVKDMVCMFLDAYSFNQDLSSWDVSNVRDGERCFKASPIEEKAKMWFPEFYV